MSNPKVTSLKNKKLTLIFLIGTVLVIIGIALWVYTDSVIQAHQKILETPNLPMEERWKYEGSLEWWKKAALTTYRPTAIALITVGICLIETAIIFLIAQPK